MNRTYDLHITVDPRTFDKSCIENPWQIHDIRNFQGIPHLIVSLKYIGKRPHVKLLAMSKQLERAGVKILREKIELHFNALQDIQKIASPTKIIEIHYKLPKRKLFKITQKQLKELNTKKIALSFNASSARPIISCRFRNKDAYRKSRLYESSPPFVKSTEQELVVFDTNSKLDAFWPVRSRKDAHLSPDFFPTWAVA